MRVAARHDSLQCPYMASIHIKEIAEILFSRGQRDAVPPPRGYPGQVLEIRFDDPAHPSSVVDEEFKNRVIPVECPFGSVVISFDESGQLKSIDLS